MQNFGFRTGLAEEKTNFKQQEKKIKGKIIKKRLDDKEKNEKVFSFSFQEIPLYQEELTLKYEIKKVLNKFFSQNAKKILIAGIGNSEILADSLGARTAEKIIATKIEDRAKRDLFIIKTEVQGKTGIDSVEFIRIIAQKLKADAVIVIDALASRSVKRLLKTIQIGNKGISPGSSVKNDAGEINEEIIGVPVVSIGVPTVVDAKGLIFELTGNKELIEENFIVTPANADIYIEKLSEIISSAINEFAFDF